MASPFRVLVFTKTAGFRHTSIPAGIAMFQRLASASQKLPSSTASAFAVDASEDATLFAPASLACYRVIVLLNVSGDFLDAAQLAALEAYVRSGAGGIVGIHLATLGVTSPAIDPQRFYARLLGAVFTGHPPPQLGRLVIKDRAHPVVAALLGELSATEASVREPSYSCFDEWYNFAPASAAVVAARRLATDVKVNSVQGAEARLANGVAPSEAEANDDADHIHVLLAADEETYTGGEHGAHHPIAWCQDFEDTGTRVFYTALGHFDESYEDEAFSAHLRDAVLWTAKVL